MNRRNFVKQQGFTIIELMLATAVFSLVLLLCTASLIQVSRMYYKGVTSASTQAAARGVMDDISRPLQFSGDTPLFGGVPGPGATASFCLGTQRFSYILDRQLNDSPSAALNQSQHVLWRDTMSSSGSCPPLALNATTPSDGLSTGDGVEMLAPNMRLSRLVVQSAGLELWRVEVSVIYGDEDLIDRITDPTRITCSGSQIGSQFCAVSELSTVVSRRLR